MQHVQHVRKFLELYLLSLFENMSEFTENKIRKSAVATIGQQDVKVLKFDCQQAHLLHKFSEDIAAIGGPQAKGARMKSSLAATELKLSLSAE